MVMIQGDIDYDTILEKTEGFSGAEIEQVVKNTITEAITRSIDSANENIYIVNSDIVNAINIVAEKNNMIKKKHLMHL